jgi:hypothetical protein
MLTYAPGGSNMVRLHKLLLVLFLAALTFVIGGCWGSHLTGGIADEGGGDGEIPILTPSCVGEIAGVAPVDFANCTFLNDDGEEVVGEPYHNGEPLIRVPCPADNVTVDFYEPESSSLNAKSLSDRRKVGQMTVNIRANHSVKDTYSLGDSRVDDVIKKATAISDGCTCRIFSTWRAVIDPQPNIGAVYQETMAYSNERYSLGDVDTVDWELRGKWCDIGDDGSANCVDDRVILANSWTELSEVRVIDSSFDDLVSKVLLIARPGGIRYPNSYLWTTDMTSPVTLDDADRINNNDDVNIRAGPIDVVVIDGVMHTASAIVETIGEGRAAESIEKIKYCYGPTDGSSSQCEEILITIDGSPVGGTYLSLIVDEASGKVIILYLAQGLLETATPLRVAVGPNGFNEVEVVDDADSGFDAVIGPDGKLHIVYTYGEVNYQPPMNLQYSIVDLDTISVDSNEAITEQDSAYFKVGNPSILFDSRDRLHVVYGARYYKVEVISKGVRGIITPPEDITTGITLLREQSDGSFSQLQNWGGVWADVDPPSGNCQFDAVDRLICTYTDFDHQMKISIFN